MTNNALEIPQSLREASEQSVKQAHAAYEQLMGFVTKTADGLMGAFPSNPMTAGFRDIQARAMEIATENAESAFAFAGRICNAQTFPEILTLHTQFAQDRMQAFVSQTQQLYTLIAEAFQKSERSGLGNGLAATPQNQMVAGFAISGFKDIQERAVSMAKKNAEATLALVEKVAKAQNFQEIVAIQTRFAQDQMQAYTLQAQEIQRLVGEALQKQPRG